MFQRFENLIDPTRTPGETPPPQGLLAFFWHYARQVRGPIAGLFLGGLFVALLDASIPICIGRVAGLVATMPPGGLLRDQWPQLAVMALIVLVLRPCMVATQAMLVNQAINPGFSNLIRWQSHWNVVRQSWTFFQNDFAGRIANRVLQTGPALREVIVSAVDSVWYILVVGGSAVTVLASTDYRLALPILAWFATYAVLLRAFVPRLRDRSRQVAEVRSGLTGRIVDAYTNILTVKLFAKPRDEDAFVRESVDEHTAAFRAQTRMISTLILSLTAMNAVLLVGMAALAITLWSQGRIAVGLVATAMALAWQITNTAGWVARSVTAIFENVGIVQDGMRSIAVPRQMPDRPGAADLQLVAGQIRFDHVRRAARHRPDGRAGRADGSGRRVRRGQVHPGEPAARLLHAGGRTHPDRRPGHRRRDPGNPAGGDRHGDAGHVAAAPLDPRQHPLWPPRRHAGRRGGSGPPGAGARFYPAT